MTDRHAAGPPQLQQVLVACGAVLLATGFALLAWWPVYRTPAFILMAAVTSVIAVVIAYAGFRLRLGFAASALAAAIAFLLTGVPLAVPDRAFAGVLPTVQGIVELFASVALGWKRLLTISLPVGDYQALLVPAMVSTLCCVLIATAIALRTRRPELAMVPVIVLAVLGVAFGPETAWMPVLTVLGLLAVSLLWFTWCRLERRRSALARLHFGESPMETAPGAVPVGRESAGLGSLLGAGTVFAIAAAAAVATVVIAPPVTERTVARTLVEQPFDHSSYVSPLVAYRTNLLPERVDQVLFTVRGFPESANIRLTGLDRWDGVVYGLADATRNSENVFERVPYRITREASGDRYSAQIEIHALDGPWLPTIGLLEAFEAVEPSSLADRFYYGESVAAGALTGALEQGVTYRIEGVVPARPDPAELSALTPGTALMPQSATPPDALTAWLDETVGAIERPGARLVAAIAAMREQGYVSHGIGDDPASRSGHSADRIAELMTARPMLGDAEQYAVAAALMARQLGFPARVVVGFQPAAPPAPTTAVPVTGADATAWIEVDTAEHGWVAFDPNPDPRPVPEREPQDRPEASNPRTIVPPPDEQEPPPPEAQVPSAEQPERDAEEPWVGVLLAILRVVGAVLLLALVVVAPLCAIALAKWNRRRRRRRAATLPARIDGAWREFEDALVDHGFPLPPASTRSEVSMVAGSATAAALAYAVDRAEFAPEPPVEDHAVSVWHTVDVLRAELNQARTRRERLRALASPASLGRYSGKRARRTTVRGIGDRRESVGEAES